MKYDSTMKAWKVYNHDDEYAVPVHGETRGKALARASRCWPDSNFDWVFMRCIRFPELDYIPFTGKNTAKYFTDDMTGETLKPEYWINDCNCALCS